MRSFVLLSVPLLFLAGCAGPDEEAPGGSLSPGLSGATTAAPAGLDFAKGIPVPAWSVGDWWQ